MVNSKIGFVLLLVRNPQESANFYENILEIKPIETSPTFVMFKLKNDIILGLWSKYTVEPRTDALAGAVEICFETENVENTYEIWGKKGITIAQKPTEMDFGKTFVALDPDGHRLRVYKLRAN